MPDFGKVKTELPEGIEVFLDQHQLQKVLKRKKPTKFFWCDMTDLFGHWVRDEWIDQCFAVMCSTPQHTHQVLTKRPDRAAEWFGSDRHKLAGRHGAILGSAHFQLGLDGAAFDFPTPNIQVGVSVENQAAAELRIQHLLKIPVAVRFLSMEPLLGPVDLDMPRCEFHNREFVFFDKELGCECCSECRADGGIGEMPSGWWLDSCACETQAGINWVIVGGESGNGARPMHPDWVREICAQCMDAGVPFFFKQWGEWLPVEIEDKPVSYRRAGKKAAGRMLDGREWSEFPAQPIPF